MTWQATKTASDSTIESGIASIFLVDKKFKDFSLTSLLSDLNEGA